MGQSLLSAHYAAWFAHNHVFFDPNVWYSEDELRKQVESFAGCFVLTGQEAPETTKRMREDLFKKTMSADGIAGRKPYGITTRHPPVIGTHSRPRPLAFPVSEREPTSYASDIVCPPGGGGWQNSSKLSR